VVFSRAPEPADMKTVGLFFLLLGICFASPPGLAQAVRDETAAKGKIQRWLQKNTGGPPQEESPIFYVSQYRIRTDPRS
jgi:hypothetical protein